MKINGVDIWLYRALLLDESYSGLFKYPTREAVRFTDYAEVDGITCDLRKFETRPRTVTLSFLLMHSGGIDSFRASQRNFCNLIEFNSHCALEFDFGLTHMTYYQGVQVGDVYNQYVPALGGTVVRASFIEPEFPVNSSVLSGVGGVPFRGVASINGADFADFGVCLNPESSNIGLIYPEKKGVFTDGVSYYFHERKKKSADITLNVTVHGQTKTDFATNYQAFYNQFARNGLQKLYFKEIGREIDVFYKDCTMCDAHVSNSRIAVKMHLKFAVPIVPTI